MTNEITTALEGVGTTLTTAINPGTIASIIGIVLGSGILLFLTWFGIRKLVSVAKNGLRGRLKI